MLAEAGAVIVRHRNTIMNTEQWHRLEGWLQLLPPDMLATRPELLLITTLEQELRQELYGSLESTRCFQLYAMSDGTGAVEAARRSLALLPDDSLAERGFAFIILSAALQMTGKINLEHRTPRSAVA